MSEKRSDTSTPPPRDDVPTLLLDENLSSSDIAQFLRRLHKEWIIELHTDHFERGASDVEVIKECAALGWVLISCDDRIRYVPQNKAAVLEHGLRVFMFGKGNYQGVEYAAALIVARGQIINAIRKTAGHLLARLQIRGEVTILEPKQDVGGLSSRDKTARKYGSHVLKKNA